MVSYAESARIKVGTPEPVSYEWRIVGGRSRCRARRPERPVGQANPASSLLGRPADKTNVRRLRWRYA